MLIRLFFTTVILLTQTFSAVSDDAPKLGQEIPSYAAKATAGVASFATVLQVPRSQAAAIPLIHFSSSQPAYMLNHLKGEFGERLMDSVLTNKLLQSTGWSVATPAHIGRTGIDGLYFKLDRNGLPRDLLVSDAKYGSSELGMTKDGAKQMSQTWIIKRLPQTSKVYREMSQEMHVKKVIMSDGTLKNKASHRIKIPLTEKTTVELWRDGQNIRYFCADKTVSVTHIQNQLQVLSRYLDKAAEGKVGYRSRLFSYKPYGTEHQFTISTLDKNADVVSKQTVRGEYSKLPPSYQKLIKSNVERTLLSLGKSREEVRMLTRQICQMPEEFNRLCFTPQKSIRAGLDSGSFRTAGLAAGIGVGFDMMSQYFETGEIDIRKTAVTGGVVFTSVVVGNYVGTQTSLLLSKYPILSQHVGGVIGGATTSILTATGLYATGRINSKTAARIAATGSAVAAGTHVVTTAVSYTATQTALWYAANYGVASTGTRIALLHGAAKTSATLAWLGGGSVATGGTGVAGGGAALANIAGPVVWVGEGVILSYMAYKHLKDDAEQYRYLTESIKMTKQRVQEGKQHEWNALIK
jgi:hypothetical protein